MGNAVRRLAGCCIEPSTSDQFQVGGQYPGQHGGKYPRQYTGQVQQPMLRPHSVPVENAGFAALARDLLQFETTNGVPDGLSQYVQSTKATQVKWYRKLLVAWKSAQLPPTNAGEASLFLRQTLQGHRKADVQGLLSFYGLPGSGVSVPSSAHVVPAPVAFIAGGTWPQGVKYEIQTLPLDDRAVGDGDSFTVFVDVRTPRETAAMPQGIMEAASRRHTARAHHDYITADALHKQIKEAGYKVFNAKDGNGEVLAKKYRIRLRGVDAPESSQPYGAQAKSVLNGLIEGHPVLVHVYDVDRYGRLVGDVHCNRIFIQDPDVKYEFITSGRFTFGTKKMDTQAFGHPWLRFEVLLKKGCAWHYTQYDSRPTFAQWEKEAKVARIGLWAVANPEKPWEYRKQQRLLRARPR